MKSSNPIKEKIMIGIALVLILIILGKVFFLPKIGEIFNFKKELRMVAVALRLSDKSMKNLCQKNVMEQRGKFDLLKNRFLHEYQIPELLQELTGLAEQIGLDIESIKPKVMMLNDFFKQVLFEINIESEYQQMVNYLDGLEKQDNVFDIEEIQIQGIENQPPQLRVKLVVSAYVLK